MADFDPRAGDGSARSPGISWTELMQIDGRPAPDMLTQESYEYRGSEPLRHPALHQRGICKAGERDKMWPHVWQFAAREEDLPEAGDYVVFENAGRSWLISRQEDGSVKAMHNVCLHRARKLRLEDGTADKFICPFHGFSWDKDGSFNGTPCDWDFGHLTKSDMQLPEAEVGRWGGYIFLREEAGGPSLEEFLAPIPRIFQTLAARRMHHGRSGSPRKCLPTGRQPMEAFMEAWHTIITHPQILPFTGDCNSRAYWTWGDNVNVNLVPFGVPSPHLDASGKPEQWIVDEFIKYNGRSADNYDAKTRWR